MSRLRWTAPGPRRQPISGSQKMITRSFKRYRLILKNMSRGFTLIELMVSIAILSILLTLAAPSFKETIANHRVKAAATDLHMSMLKARSEAISRNTDVAISSPGWESGWQVKRGDVVIENHDALKGVSISDPGTLTYRSSGRIKEGDIKFQIVSETVTSKKRCVSVDLSGRPYIKEGACP